MTPNNNPEIISNEAKCMTDECQFLKNQNPDYLKQKPAEHHPYCCSACLHSNGEKHGPWCQKNNLSTQSDFTDLMKEIEMACIQKEAKPIDSTQKENKQCTPKCENNHDLVHHLFHPFGSSVSCDICRKKGINKEVSGFYRCNWKCN